MYKEGDRGRIQAKRYLFQKLMAGPHNEACMVNKDGYEISGANSLNNYIGNFSGQRYFLLWIPHSGSVF